MNGTDTANAYLRTRVMTATPEELRLMLLDGAIKFARQAEYGLDNKDYEASFAGFSQCRDIVLELMRTIDDKHDPDLANRVRSLYAFLYTELVEASFDKDKPRLLKAIELLEYERETWKLLMDKLAEERGTAPTTTAATPARPAPAPNTLATAVTPSSLSVQA